MDVHNRFFPLTALCYNQNGETTRQQQTTHLLLDGYNLCRSWMMLLCHVNCQWVLWRAGSPWVILFLPCWRTLSRRRMQGNWKRRCCHPSLYLLRRIAKVQQHPWVVRMFWRSDGGRWTDINTRSCLNGLNSWRPECSWAEGKRSRWELPLVGYIIGSCNAD